jgi:hypothetical protein
LNNFSSADRKHTISWGRVFNKIENFKPAGNSATFGKIFPVYMKVFVLKLLELRKKVTIVVSIFLKQRKSDG